MFRKRVYIPIFKFIMVFVVVVLLAGCGKNSTPATPDLNRVATIVAATITARPKYTSLPEIDSNLISPTFAPPTNNATNTPTTTITPTQMDTPTQSKTPTQTILPTLAEEDPKVKFGTPTWSASLKDNSSWYTFEDKQASIQVKDSTLVLTSLKANNYESWSMSYPNISNFYLEIQGTSGENCQGKDRYGLIFRAPNPNEGYLFGISCDGFFRLRAWDGKKFTDITRWQASEFVRTGAKQTNRIGVMADDDEISLYVNGHLVEKLWDDTYDKGVFGAYVAASETPGFTVIINQVAYWENP